MPAHDSDKAANKLRRYASTLRKVSTTTVRKPWRQPYVRRQKSKEERSKLKIDRAANREAYREALATAQKVVMDQAIALRERFGKHSIDYYYEEIMQQSRLAAHSRKATRWNAYLKQEVQRINSELPAGQKRHKSSELALRDISTQWKAMSTEEQEAATTDALKTLEDFREMKQFAPHNVMLNAFADAQKTLIQIDHELTALNARTGIEFILLGVRPDTHHWNQPHVFHTQRVKDFFEYSYKSSISTLAYRLEGFCISGVQGIAKTHLDEVLELKKKTTEIILQRLREAAAPAHVNRMFYTNFDTNITEKYRVVVENWPLSKFTSPGDISSRNELRVLYQAWESGATRFRKFTNEEFEQWDNARVDVILNQNHSTESNPSTGAESATSTPSSTPDTPSTTATATQSTATLGPSTSTLPSSLGSTTTSTPAPTTSLKRMRAAHQVVFSISGEDMPLTKKPRKERKDKGTTRGPRQKKGAP